MSSLDANGSARGKRKRVPDWSVSGECRRSSRNGGSGMKNGEVGFVVEKRVLRSSVAKVIGERNGVDRGSGDERDLVEKKIGDEAVLSTDQNGNISSGREGVLRSDVAEQSGELGTGNDDEISKRNDTDKMNCEEETATRSDVGRRREEAGIGEEKCIQEGGIDGSKDKEGDAPASDPHGNGTDTVKSDEKIEVEKNWVKGAHINKRREDRKINEVLVVEKRITRSSVAKQREYASTDKSNIAITGKDNKELMNYEKSDIEEKLIMRSDVASEEFDTLQKKSTESGLSTKRRGETLDVETTGNKLKVQSLIQSDDQARDGQNDKEMMTSPKKISKLETENIKQIKHSGQRTLERRNDNGAHPVGAGVTHQKGGGLKCLGGILNGLSRNNKTSMFEKSTSLLEDEESRKTPRLPSIGNQNALRCGSLYVGKKNLKKTSSMISVGKGQMRMEKATSAQKKIIHELKRGHTQNNLESSNDKSQVMVTTSETSLSARQIEVAAGIERKIARQKLRDQIKDILLNADWKIELMPRKGKGYADSVYISPQGSRYWSILTAYDVFRSQLNCADGIKVMNSFGKSSNMLKGNHHKFRTGSLFSAIPMEALSILKKVIKKRRSKKEIEEAKRKLEDGRTKKAKGTSVKHPRNEQLKNKSREFKERTKRNYSVDSSDKGIVGYMHKRPLPERSREKRKGIALLARGSNKKTKTGTDVYVPYAFRRTILSWMMDLGTMPTSGKVRYMNWNRTRAMLEGWITRNGIHCSCCCKILTVSMFEVHAGSRLRQPYQNIYLEEVGISLLQCQLNAWDKQDESVCRSFCSVDTDDDPNDDTCGICGDGGDLICCDGCPSTFHLSCLGLQMLPPGDWHCMHCSCRFCGLESSSDAQENGVIDYPLLSCSQCEAKYHQKCVPEEVANPVCSSLPYISFCCHSCKKVFKGLQKLIGVKNDMEAGFSLTLLQRLDEELPESVCRLDQRVERNSKIAVALAVMDECFVPIIDQRSGINLLHNVVYNCGSNFSRLNYRGFYTFILERHDEIISVASLRIHGTRLAEMPFIGTRNMYRRQGMCRRLLNGIETALCSLNIEKLIIPAISDLMDTWTNVFGFRPVEISQTEEVKSVNLLVFPGTGLLFKPLQRRNSSKHRFGVDKYETDSKYNDPSDIAKESCYSRHGSEPQALEYKSSAAATDHSLLQYPEVVYHVEPAVDNNLQVVSSLGHEIELPSAGNVHSNSKEKVRGASVVRNPLAVSGILAKHTYETKCRSPDDSTSTLNDSGSYTATNMCAVDGTLLPHLTEVHCTSPSTITSTLGDSGGNDLHVPVCSKGLSSDASHFNGADIASKTDVIFPIGHGFPVSTECVIDNQNIKHQVGTLEPKFSEHLKICHAQTISGSLGAVANNFLSTTEQKIHAVDDCVVHSAHELRGKLDDVGPKTFVDDVDAKQCASEVNKTSIYVARGKECQVSSVSSASSDSGIISIDTASVHSVRRSIQHSSELKRKPSENLSEADHPFASDELHENKHDLVNSLNVTSLPVHTVGMLSSSKINDDTGYVESLNPLSES